jgi:hypothetical protein
MDELNPHEHELLRNLYDLQTNWSRWGTLARGEVIKDGSRDIQFLCLQSQKKAVQV